VTFPVPVREAILLRDRYAELGGFRVVAIRIQLPSGKIYDRKGRLDVVNNTIGQGADTIILRGTVENFRNTRSFWRRSKGADRWRVCLGLYGGSGAGRGPGCGSLRGSYRPGRQLRPCGRARRQSRPTQGNHRTVEQDRRPHHTGFNLASRWLWMDCSGSAPGKWSSLCWRHRPIGGRWVFRCTELPQAQIGIPLIALRPDRDFRRICGQAEAGGRDRHSHVDRRRVGDAAHPGLAISGHRASPGHRVRCLSRRIRRGVRGWRCPAAGSAGRRCRPNAVYEIDSGNDGIYTLTASFELGTDPDINTVNINNRVQIALSQLPTEVNGGDNWRSNAIPCRHDDIDSVRVGLESLVTATGAAELSRRAVGTAVISGMLAANSIGLFLIPKLYVTLQKLRER
jgi:hypothetical protein